FSIMSCRGRATCRPNLSMRSVIGILRVEGWMRVWVLGAARRRAARRSGRGRAGDGQYVAEQAADVVGRGVEAVERRACAIDPEAGVAVPAGADRVPAVR